MESRIVIIPTVIIILASVPFVMGWLFSAPVYKGPVTDHFDGKKFHNPGNVPVMGWKEVFKWARNREKGPWVEKPGPVAWKSPPALVQGDSLQVTFVNHSTFLIQLHGLNILTDPIWSERASPLSWAGPKRMRPPGIPLEGLPKIDFILLSHNHYDHLDSRTLKWLSQRDHPTIICPLGVSLYLTKKGIKDAMEMDWWDEYSLDENIKVVCTPAQHFSGRGMFDRNRTLWAGFGILTPEGTVYFAGDSGYGSFFREIGKKIGTIRLALIPIGAYKPQWFMAPIHTSPEDAVKVHLDINSTKTIGTHFGTFPLADDGMEDPVKDLDAALKKFKVPADRFLTLKEGEAAIL